MIIPIIPNRHAGSHVVQIDWFGVIMEALHDAPPTTIDDHRQGERFRVRWAQLREDVERGAATFHEGRRLALRDGRVVYVDTGQALSLFLS